MTSRSRGARVLVMLVMLLGSVLASAAGADTTDDLTRAWQRMVAAQAAADAAAARYEAALAGHARLEDELAQTQQRIAETEAVAKVLTKQVQAIAARAYVTAGEPAVGALFSGDDVLDLGRSTRLLDRANAPNVATIDRLAAAKEDLDRDHARVAAAEKESAQLLASLQSESNRVQQELTAAGNAKAQIEQRIEQVKQQAIQDDARETEERAVAGVTTTTTRPARSTTHDHETEHADDQADHADDEAHDADDEAEPTAAASATAGEPGLPGARSGELRRQLGRAAFGRTNAPRRRHDGRARHTGRRDRVGHDHAAVRQPPGQRCVPEG